MLWINKKRFKRIRAFFYKRRSFLFRRPRLYWLSKKAKTRTTKAIYKVVRSKAQAWRKIFYSNGLRRIHKTIKLFTRKNLRYATLKRKRRLRRWVLRNAKRLRRRARLLTRKALKYKRYISRRKALARSKLTRLGAKKKTIRKFNNTKPKPYGHKRGRHILLRRLVPVLSQLSALPKDLNSLSFLNSGVLRLTRSYIRARNASVTRVTHYTRSIYPHSGSTRQGRYNKKASRMSRFFMLGRPSYSYAPNLHPLKKSHAGVNLTADFFFYKPAIFCPDSYLNPVDLKTGTPLTFVWLTRFLLHALFIPDLIVPRTFLSSSTNNLLIDAWFGSIANMKPEKLSEEVTNLHHFNSPGNPLSLVLLNLSFLNNHPISPNSNETHHKVNLVGVPHVLTQNPARTYAQLIWAHDFGVSWMRTQFFLFVTKRKVYLGSYAVAPSVFLNKLTYYPSNVNQDTFKSAMLCPIRGYPSRLSYLAGDEEYVALVNSVSAGLGGISGSKGQLYIAGWKKLLKRLNLTKKFIQLARKPKLNKPKGSQVYDYLSLKYISSKLPLSSHSLHLKKHLRFKQDLFSTYSRYQVALKKRRRSFVKWSLLRSIRFYSPWRKSIRLKKRLRKQRRRLTRFRSRFKRLNKFNWRTRAMTWLGALLADNTQLYKPALLFNNTLGLRAARYCDAGLPYLQQTPGTPYGYLHSYRYRVYRSSLRNNVTQTQPDLSFIRQFQATSFIPLTQFLKKNNDMLLFFSSFFLKYAYYVGPASLRRSVVSFISSFSSNSMCTLTNLVPNNLFRASVPKLLYAGRSNMIFQENVTPWAYATLIQFIEFHSGKKVLVDVDSFMAQGIDSEYVTVYKSWLLRFNYYQRRLGHRFFLEEALHIIHMSFTYRDSKLISTWLKAIIQRISFWKTRFIFRFLKYLLNNYFLYFLQELGIKGLKIKLKGKISVAGNSRKRTILYRLGKTSHGESKLKVVHTMDTIVTFTGVMGFQIWLFY